MWAHNGMLRLAGEKMSKSRGNIDPLHDALDRWGAETFIMFMLQAHYASPVDYTDAALERARAACETLRNRLRESGAGRDPAVDAAVCDALDDDFTHPRALALLFDAPPEARDTVARACWACSAWAAWRRRTRRRPSVVELAERPRGGARRRDFAESDRLREEIAAARLGGARHRRGPRLYRRG